MNGVVGGVKESLAVLLDIQRNYNQILKRTSRRHGLTTAEWQLLKKVTAGYNTQNQLVAETKLDVSTLSRQLSRLVEKKLLLIKKLDDRPSLTARKKYSYQVTNRGNDSLTAMGTDLQKMKDDLFSPWTQDEQNLLKILLNRLNTSFDRLES